MSNEHVVAAHVAAGRFGSAIKTVKFAIAHVIERGVQLGLSEGAGTNSADRVHLKISKLFYNGYRPPPDVAIRERF